MHKTIMSAVTHAELLEMTAGIVSAYVGNNSLPPGELPSLIESVHQALVKVTDEGEDA